MLWCLEKSLDATPRGALAKLSSGAQPLKFRRFIAQDGTGGSGSKLQAVVPGKPPYPGAWPLNFRGCCPGIHPKCSLNFRAKIFSAKTCTRCRPCRGQSHDRQDLGKIRYSGPVLYFIFKTVLNSRETVLCVKSVFYTALTIRRTRFISAKASRKIISEAVVLVSPKSLQSQQLALRTSKSFNRSVLQMLHNQQLLAM